MSCNISSVFGNPKRMSIPCLSAALGSVCVSNAGPSKSPERNRSVRTLLSRPVGIAVAEKISTTGTRQLRAWGLALVIGFGGCASAPTISSPAKSAVGSAQIQNRLNEIFDAAAKQDLPRLDSYHYYGPKFTKFPAAPIGRQDAAGARQGEHDGLGAISALTMQAEDLKIDLFGDVGIATFILHSHFKASAGLIERKERATLVFVKDHGAWKIAHEHFSPFKVEP